MRVLITGGSGFIGTNLVDFLVRSGYEVANLDYRPPLKKSHVPYWTDCDILNLECVEAAFRAFRPESIVHLAARTDSFGRSVKDYTVNVAGTRNVIMACSRHDCVSRVVVVSSQFVHGPRHIPAHDEDFEPVNAYGESKAIAERETRYGGLECTWTIVRPTNIWGPWHPRYPYEIWRYLARGLYFHPNGGSVLRCYGYVRNVVHQVEQILNAPPSMVAARVFYLGDPPIDLVLWVNAFSRGLCGRDVRTLPRGLLRIIARLGDTLTTAGARFPLHSSRFRSMTEDYLVPMEPTLDAFGPPKVSLEEAVVETITWLRVQGLI